MMMKRTLNPTCLMLILGMAAGISAQNDHSVLLRTGKTIFPENIKEYTRSATIGSTEMIGDHYYRLIQFFELPGNAVHQNLAKHGIQLLEYIPNKTYVASIPTSFDIRNFEALGVRSIQPIPSDLKLSPQLKSQDLPNWTVQKNKVLAMLKFYKDLDHATVLRYCEADGIKVIHENGYNNFLRVSLPQDKIAEIINLPYIAYLEPVPAPDVPDDHLGRSLHRTNTLDAEFDAVKHYNGEGISMLVRDDGVVGPHIDFKGRIDNSMVDPQSGSHGDGVAGIMGAAGNIDPKNRGMADGAFLYILNYQADFLDETMDLFFNNNVLVTNSSYSNGCNDGYTEITETIDQQLYNNPSLIHVFSAGNSNGSDCEYGAGPQWGNITGGHKQAKNCITTANLNAEAVLNNSSSRGPAHDGRIKPDISAYGDPQVSNDENNAYQVFGGTSAASPGIAGVMAQLHHAYQDLNQGEVADAALLKASLLNTANDLGNPGPDFKFGWGHVNAYRAALTLEEHRYLKATIDPNGANVHSITVPDNVMQLRVMVYWSDPEGTVLTTKALVNNINATLQTPTNSIIFPWVLNPAPNPSTLNSNATKGMDNLNNMEQMSIDNPPAGNYNVAVHGAELPFGAHSYYVVWEFRTIDIAVTHPYGGESFEPGETVRIHWDAEGTADMFEISYSTDGGMSYQPITTVTGTNRMFDWTAPDAITGQAMVKVTRAGVSGQSAAPFSIVPRPTDVNVNKACPDYLSVSWTPVDLGAASGTTEYEVFLLGEKYMESMGTTTASTFDLPTIDLNPTLDHWIAVRTLGDNGMKSERTIAIQYNNGLLDCAQEFDMSLISIISPSAGSISGCATFEADVEIMVSNAGILPLTDVEVMYQLDNEPPVVEVIPGTIGAGETIPFTFSTPISISGNGSHSLTVSTILANDLVAFNNTISQNMDVAIYPGTGEPVDYQEDFEGPVFPPPYYIVVNADNLYTWQSANVPGSNGNPTTAFFVNNYEYSTEGEEDEFLTIPIDLSNVTAPALSFDLAYAYYNSTWQDGLRVEISTDCGTSFNTVLFDKSGPALATAGSQSNFFVPNGPNQWRNETIDLTPFIGNAVVLKFINVNGYGNSMYIDNINVSNLVAPNASFQVSTNEVCQGETVTFTSTSTGSNMTHAWNFGPGAVPPVSSNPGPVTVTFQQPGNPEVTLTVSNVVGQSVAENSILVTPDPIPAFTYQITDATVTFTNTSQFSNDFTWDFGDGSTATDENPVYTFGAPTTYNVELTAINDCDEKSVTVPIDITYSSVNELEQRLKVELSPNPANGLFQLSIISDRAEQLSVGLYDVRGVLFERKSMNIWAGNNFAQFDASYLPAGLYIIKISGQDGAKVLKLAVE